ncbi:MAG: PIG-L family deacetylase [Terriglobia bacterium]
MRLGSKGAAWRLSLWLLAAGGLAAAAAASPPAPAASSARLEKLPVITTIAYITAHPDDESGAIISYFARGLGARVVILCLTRGEGGQNTYGPELGEELGRIRTRELEAAARLYGAEVRFVGALDFGYSKSVEETLERWDEPALLERLVRVLRELKPDVVLTVWTPEAPAGAQHQAAGILVRQAYALMGDPAAYPEQRAAGLQPWPARYLVTQARGPSEDENLRVPVEEIDAASGKSYREIGWEGIRQHRSQGLDRIPREVFRRFRRRYFLHVDALRVAAPMPRRARDLVQQLDALPVVFPTVGWLAAWERRLVEVVARVQSAQASAQAGLNGSAARKLVEAAAGLTELQNELKQAPAAGGAGAVVAARQRAFLRAAAELAGIKLAARADRARVAPGERIRVRVQVTVGAPDVLEGSSLKVGEVRLLAPAGWRVEPVMSEAAAKGRVREFSVTVAQTGKPAEPRLAGLEGEAMLAANSLRVPLREAVRGPAASEAGGHGKPLRVVPRVKLALEPALRLVPTTLAGDMLDWEVLAERHGTEREPLRVALEVPAGWSAPLPQSIPTHNPAHVRMRFQASLPARLEPGRLPVRALALGAAPAEGRLEVLEVSPPPGLRIGYIGFNNDPVPALLAQLGIGVDMLDASNLRGGALDAYDAIVVAERAYDFREDLAAATPRLLDYVEGGGTLVVEHQGRRWEATKYMPYPVERRGNLRVTDETAAVRVLVPDHPALNFPHRIHAEDWNGWVQERGLYFMGEWDVRFTPLLEMADPGEEALRGGLLYARAGDGVYIYCGLALFRQVRAGVAGGVRLFVNLVSQGRALKASTQSN